MRPLPDRHLDVFIELYQKRFGIALERAVALEKGLQLCRFVEKVVMHQKSENLYGRARNEQLCDFTEKCSK